MKTTEKAVDTELEKAIGAELEVLKKTLEVWIKGEKEEYMKETDTRKAAIITADINRYMRMKRSIEEILNRKKKNVQI